MKSNSLSNFFVSIFCFNSLYNSLLILASRINENLLKIHVFIYIRKQLLISLEVILRLCKKNNSEYVNQMTFDIQNISVQVLSNFLKSNLKIYSISIIFVAIIYIDFANALILMIIALISYFLIFKNIKKYISKSGKSNYCQFRNLKDS